MRFGCGEISFPCQTDPANRTGVEFHRAELTELGGRGTQSDRSGSSDENALRGASDVIFAAEGRWRGSVFSIRE
ncbi:uncharacterized [Tachysurus ichikawai]